ncbi:MAG TPA: hypothetical protein VOA64_19770 [Candidatus Dormibacteraeota bacterium]|nr:hypothetical protein [Candidatus Dormibacteraeota bacterium]
MMIRTGISLIVGTVFAVSASARSQTDAQAGTQRATQSSTQTGTKQAQASGGAWSSTSAQADSSGAVLSNGTSFNALLSAPVDSKKSRPGDLVSAKTTEAAKSDGKVILPKGTNLVGHVTQASARANGDAESAIAIQFDKAILGNGEEFPLNLAIQALAASQTSASAAGADVDSFGGTGASAVGSGAAGGRGLLGVVASAAGGTLNSAAGSSKRTVGGLNSAGQLASDSRGVFGLTNLNLNTAVSNTTQGSVIASAGKNVYLHGGTRLLLVSQTQATSQIQ